MLLSVARLFESPAEASLRFSRLGAVSAERVALVPECVECGAIWLPADEERWRLVRVDLYESVAVNFYELAWYCRDCAEREFGRQVP